MDCLCFKWRSRAVLRSGSLANGLSIIIGQISSIDTSFDSLQLWSLICDELRENLNFMYCEHKLKLDTAFMWFNFCNWWTRSARLCSSSGCGDFYDFYLWMKIWLIVWLRLVCFQRKNKAVALKRANFNEKVAAEPIICEMEYFHICAASSCNIRKLKQNKLWEIQSLLTH